RPSATPARETPAAGSARSPDPPPQRRPPGARRTAHRATTPCTGRETSALQGRGEPRTERQPPARDGKRQPSRGAGNRALSNNPPHWTGNVNPPRGAGNRAQLSNAQHWTGYVTLSGARGTAHTPNDRWGPAPHRERNPTHQADGSHTVRNANTTLCPPNPNESFSAAIRPSTGSFRA